MAIINTLFAMANLLGLIWVMVGVPIGIVFAVAGFTSKNKVLRKKYIIIALVGLGGIGFLIGMFILYFIYSLIVSFLGLPPPSVSIK